MITAIRDIKQGEEIFDSYGSDKTNGMLMFAYGFAIPDEAHMDATLYVRTSTDDPFLKEKQTMAVITLG